MKYKDKTEQLINRGASLEVLNQERYYQGISFKKQNNLNLKNCSLISLCLIFTGVHSKSQEILFAAALFSILALFTSFCEFVKTSNYGTISILWGVTSFFKHSFAIVMIICLTIGIKNSELYLACSIVYGWMACFVILFELETNEFRGDGYWRMINRLEVLEAGSKILTVTSFILINLDIINYKSSTIALSALVCSGLASAIKIADECLVWSKSYAEKISTKMFEEKMKTYKRYFKSYWIPLTSLSSKSKTSDLESGEKEDMFSVFRQNLKLALKTRSSFEILARWWNGPDCYFQEPEDGEWVGLVFKSLCNCSTCILFSTFTGIYYSANKLAAWAPSLALMVYLLFALINIQNPKKLK